MGSNRSVCLALLLAACLSMVACAHPMFRDFGRFSLNDETTRAFDSYSVNADFHYYISGSDTYPNAIIGLHRDYRIDPQSLWKKVEMTPEVMQKIVSSMKENSSTRQHFMYGFELLGPKGQPLGVWYSIPTARTCLQMKDEVTVRLDTPDVDTYEHLNGDMGMTMQSG
jgi:hypothetical protein